MFVNPPPEKIAELLRGAQVIAVGGVCRPTAPARATAWRVPCSASATASSR